MNAGTGAADATVSVAGLVSLDGRGYAGARVEALDPVALSDPEPPGPAAVSTSAEAGRFQLPLSPGAYLITARTEDRFGYFGRNPLRAGAHQRGVSLPLVPVYPTSVTDVSPGTESISGRVFRDGAPADGIIVSLYLRVGNGFRGPPYASAPPTGADGRWSIPVEPGFYFVVGRQRAGGASIGPLAPGDLFGVHPLLPLRLKRAQALETGFEVVELPEHDRMDRYRTRFATLAGRVVDAAGNPLSGFRACLYDNPKLLNDPVETSPMTGADGRFTLRTTNRGRYFLGARERLGGPPVSGERVGFPRDAPPEGFLLEPGSAVDTLTLIVQPVP